MAFYRALLVCFVVPSLWLASLAGCRTQSVLRGTKDGEIEYRYVVADCSLHSLHREGSSGLRLRFECADEAKFVEGLNALARAWRDDGIELRSLFVGRIDEQVVHGGPLGLSRKLARLSAASAEWDSKAGRARSGNSNAWMEQALRDATLLAPFTEALREGSYAIAGASVEKVRWQEASEDPVLSQEGLKGRLAWDALLYLRVGYNP